MLFMQKIMAQQEKTLQEPRKEPMVLPIKAWQSVKRPVASDKLILSKSKRVALESRKRKAEGFKQSAVNDLTGFIGAYLVDSEYGELLMKVESKDFETESNALNTEVLNKKVMAVRELGAGEELEDILITLGKQYHLIRRLKSAKDVFFCLVLDRKVANLGLAKLTLQSVEETIQL